MLAQAAKRSAQTSLLLRVLQLTWKREAVTVWTRHSATRMPVLRPAVLGKTWASSISWICVATGRSEE